MKFIHYGHSSFDKDRFVPIKNIEYANRPIGGFWGSPVDSEVSWKAFCEESGIRECDEQNSVMFTLKPDAKVYYIRSVEDAIKLPRTADRLGIANFSPDNPFSMIMGVDFEAMVKDGIDAVFCDMSKCPQLYFKLNGWDCDCILVMNPEIVVTE